MPSSSPLHHTSIPYRPEIDGLRALAVSMVVFYHASIGFPGGFVGVDVFFVISGYLITGLIWKQLVAGTFTLVDFWERRIRRIYPALVVVLVGVLLFGGLLLLPHDYAALSRAALAQVLIISNFHFADAGLTDGGYFGNAAESSPMLHGWSLAVEEQFYLLFPLILWLGYKWGWMQTRRKVVYVLTVLVLVSFALAQYQVVSIPTSAFYLLPSRAWELMLGSLVALAGTRFSSLPGWIREVFSLSGLAAILTACLVYDRETVFPGVSALLPCLGSVLVIMANTPKQEKGHAGLTWSGRCLALKPVVFIGLISYSWYLWHWPVLVLGKYWWLADWTPFSLRAGLVLGSLVLAILSWRFVETPFRKKQLLPTRRMLFVQAGISSAILLALAWQLTISQGLPQRWSEQNQVRAKAELDHVDFGAMAVVLKEMEKGQPILINPSSATDNPQILLWGDSHALHILPAMEELCQQFAVKGALLQNAVTPPLLDAVYSGMGMAEKTPEISRSVLRYVKEKGVRHVVLAARWENYQNADAVLLESALAKTIQTLHDSGVSVWVLLDVPSLPFTVPKKLILSDVLGNLERMSRSDSETHRKRNSVIYDLARRDDVSAHFIDLATLFANPETGFYDLEKNAKPFYYDDDHITTFAATEYVAPLLIKHIGPYLLKPSAEAP